MFSIRCSKRFDIFRTQGSGFSQITGPPRKRDASQMLDKDVGCEPSMAAISVGKWVYEYQTVM